MSQASKFRSRTRMTARLLALPCAFSLGCNWTEFDDYEKTAPIRVHDTPSNRKPGYGNVLTTLATDYTGSPRSLSVASAGPDAPVAFTRLWNGKQLTEDTFTRCKAKEDCENGVGVGATLIPFPHWALGTVQQQDACVFAPGYGKSYVFCDSDTSANQSFDLELDTVVEPGNSAGFSGAGLPPSHPLGVFLLGAYQISSRTEATSRGRLFYQPDFQPPGERSDDDEVPQLEELPLRDPVTGSLFADDPEAGDLGAAMAAALDVHGTLWIAVGQPAHGRVIVANFDDVPGDLDNKLSTIACIENRAMVGSFGKRLAMADINGDGLPELAVGSDLSDSNERVFLYRGDAMPTITPGSCPDWGAAPLEVTCSEGVREARCEGSAFGASLAFGDVNGDGASDLIVGAPRADVDGKHEAGAVWLFAGNASARGALLNVDGATNLYADNKASAHLGTSVGALHTKDRDEPMAGAPGEARLFTFMCSELEDDVDGNTLCLPK
jgi:FG-GAP repeat